MGIPAHGFRAQGKRAKFIVAGFVLAIITASLFWLRLQPSPGPENRTPSGQPFPNALQATADGDADGLKDWEEELWGTAADNPDSDGDGTTDGAETKLGRDPKKPGPGDALGGTPLPPGERGMATAGLPLPNLTEDFAESILQSGVLGGLKTGDTLNPIQALRKIALPERLDPKTILAEAAVASIRDFTVLEADDPEAIRSYFLGVARLYERTYLPVASTLRETDLEILAAAVAADDYTRLAALDPVTAMLARLAHEFVKVPVPQPYQDFAIQELNYILQTKRALEIFRQAPLDPVAAAVAVSRRVELLEEMGRFHEATSRRLEARGIKL